MYDQGNKGTDFDMYIGIDYSGRGKPDERTAGIQVVAIKANSHPERVPPPHSQRTMSWSRIEVYQYLRALLNEQTAGNIGRMIIGIDHGLSFPVSYFEQKQLNDWDEFLQHFQQLWNTKEEAVRVCRERIADYPNPNELRITETYTSSAKSVMNFDQKTGAVSYSTHAGLPWIYELRRRYGPLLHVWPFDGWIPQEGTSVMAEVYPALLYNRYRHKHPWFPQDWPRDAQDAFVIAAWLQERDQNRTLQHYFQLITLTEEEKKTALQKEGWILGVC